jgi:hypothetical protein
VSDYILAKAFACADDREQAEMLNTMGRELFVHCRGHSGLDQQACFIAKYLNNDGAALLRRLLEFYELRNKEIP